MKSRFGGASLQDVDEACELADAAYGAYRATALEQRAVFLETIAQNILHVGDELVELCMAETGLPRAHIESERGRTVG